MRIRYHAQRKHVIYSLDGLLYELHTLSFLLAPSVFVLLCRCITQFQFSRARELDGRRSLRFWFVLVALVNVSAVWAHAFGSAGGGGSGGGGGGGHGVGEEKSVLLDFVGMGHRPTKLQLLLLDATIMFLQAILTTISYETSLSHAMPSDVPDPLFPAPSSISSEFSSSSEEAAPFLPYSSPDTSAIATASSATAYPPTPPIPTSSSSLTHADASTDQPPSSSLNNNDSGDNDGNSNSNSKPTPHDPLPPPLPIIDLTLRHIIHRLTSPIPELPSLRAGAAAANEGLDGGDDELAVLRLPLPNTTTVRVAHTLRIFAQARQRQRQREREQQQAARRLRRASRADGGGGGNGDGNGNDNGEDGEGRGPGRGGSARNREENGDGGGGEDERPRTARIPGAIEDEDEG